MTVIQPHPLTALPVLAALEQMGAIQPHTTAHQAVFKLRNAPLGLIREMSVHADSFHEHPASTLFRLHHSKGGVAHRLRMMGTPGASEALLQGVRDRLSGTAGGAADIVEAYFHGLALMIESDLGHSWEGATWKEKFKLRLVEAALLNDPDCRPDRDFVHAVNALWQKGIAVEVARRVGAERARPLFEVAIEEAKNISDPRHRTQTLEEIVGEARRFGIEEI